MPEITQAELSQFHRYQKLGLPDEIESKINGLTTDNGKQRDQIRDLTAKLPKEGEVIVKKADADDLVIYRELGKPGDLKTKIETGDKAQQDLGIMRTRESAVKFAEVVGLHEDSVDTLIAIPALVGAKFEVRKGKVKNKTTGKEEEGRVGYVTLAGENQKASQWDDDLKDKVPALKGLRMAEQRKQDKTFVPQGSGVDGDTKPDGSVYDRIRAKAKAQQKDSKEKAPSVEERLGLANSR